MHRSLADRLALRVWLAALAGLAGTAALAETAHPSRFSVDVGVGHESQSAPLIHCSVPTRGFTLLAAFVLVRLWTAKDNRSILDRMQFFGVGATCISNGDTIKIGVDAKRTAPDPRHARFVFRSPSGVF